MRLLVTRPRDDAEAFAGLLRARGHEAIIAPVMEVHFIPGAQLTCQGVQAVLATSANGIRALAQRMERRDLTVYAVGPQTAEAARMAGFVPVINASGDSAQLVETVAGQADPKNGVLLHAAGAETAGRVKQALTARGFAVETVVLYEALPATQLPEAALEALKNSALDGVLLFSPRSAKTFATLVQQAKLGEECVGLVAFCISAATAEALTPLMFSRVAVAGTPNQGAILDLIPGPEPVR